MRARYLSRNVNIGERFAEDPRNFQNFDFLRHQIFFRVFLPFVWVLPVAWPLAAAPEAARRCIGELSKATIPWSSGSLRRRRSWIRRTMWAVASEEDLRGKTSETGDSVVRK